MSFYSSHILYDNCICQAVKSSSKTFPEKAAMPNYMPSGGTAFSISQVIWQGQLLLLRVLKGRDFSSPL